MFQREKEPYIGNYISVAGSLLGRKIMSCNLDLHEWGWLCTAVYRPYFQNIAFRFRNRIISVLLEPIDEENKSILSKEDIETQISICRENDLTPTLFPFSIRTGKPILDNWHLKDSVTGEAIDVEKIATSEKRKMSRWEMQNSANQIASEALKEKGFTVLSSCDIPEIIPNIWFSDSRGKKRSLTVRGAMEGDDYYKVTFDFDVLNSPISYYPMHFMNIEFKNHDDPEEDFLWRSRPFQVQPSEMEDFADAFNKHKHLGLNYGSTPFGFGVRTKG